MVYAAKEPKNKKAKRALMLREPKLVENEKTAMMIHGHSISETGKLFLDEMVRRTGFGVCLFVSFFFFPRSGDSEAAECGEAGQEEQHDSSL